MRIDTIYIDQKEIIDLRKAMLAGCSNALKELEEALTDIYIDFFEILYSESINTAQSGEEEEELLHDFLVHFFCNELNALKNDKGSQIRIIT